MIYFSIFAAISTFKSFKFKQCEFVSTKPFYLSIITPVDVMSPAITFTINGVYSFEVGSALSPKSDTSFYYSSLKIASIVTKKLKLVAYGRL